ncbi:hypothetical protein [Nannocystis radixulma]|uniref:Uncharacterized protein n=1 Tax=Nannocystis radixulma TaxID=2995305 RepID=A0ABT5BCK5_9BACT|nr:hypothetical protein [Nannocystis radixulma]MDC0671846.1 hypothetical protein [Nannocystis radixulma]
MTPAELARLFDLPAEAGARAQAARAVHFGRRVLVRGAPVHAAPAVAALLRAEGPPLVDLRGWSEGHVSGAMAAATGRLGQVSGDMTDAAGAKGQGASDMSPGTGSEGQVPSDMSQGPVSDTGCDTHGAAGDGEAGDPGWPEPEALRPGDRVVLQVDRARLDAYFAYLVRLAGAAPDGLSLAPYCARAGGLLRLHLIAAARLALPGRVRVEARHDLLGIRLAQVALGFGADTLAGPLAAARKLPLAGVPRPDEATPAGLAALIERAGLEPVLHDMTSETLP